MSKKPFDPLAESIDVRKLLNSIYFEEADYATANTDQPKLMLGAARYRIQMMRARITEESALNLVKAKMALKYRQRTLNGKPLTEAAIKEKVTTNKYVHRAESSYNNALVDEELAKQLFEVYKQRGNAISNIIKANSNAIARELWQMESKSQSEKLRAAASSVRQKYGKKKHEEESDD
jgi:hypothetical protein